ncbi:hypothetical protein ABMA70_02200 [Halobacteriovorax sp. XZX-3]|uniref:hypothetical protein n=1 Tax=unclassified Halobacteriovorax TaxID=2639665 RepID=UPI003717518F
MKKLIFLMTILVLVLSSVYLVITMPYRFYYTFQDEGIQSDYFIATNRYEWLYRGLSPYEKSRGATLFWKPIHFQNFQFDIPFDDVSFKLFPRPNVDKLSALPYFDIVDHKNRRVLSVYDFEIEKFKAAIPMDPIFNLPVVTQFIKSSSNQAVWLDVLNLNIKIKKLNLYSYKNIKYLLSNYSLPKLGYFLYIYKIRNQIFSKDAKKIVQNGPFHIMQFFDGPKNSGILKNYFYEKGRLYHQTIRYNKNHPDHNVVLDKLVKNLKLSLSRDEESSLAMYNEFRKLKYEKRFEYKGMALLYSAWSHELENEAFYREMIYYLEKGNYKTAQLFSLYDFAKKKFGKTFSNRDEVLKDDLKAKIEIETKKERKKQERDLADYQISGEVDFKDDDAKLDYILKNIEVKEEKDDLSEY